MNHGIINGLSLFLSFSKESRPLSVQLIQRFAYPLSNIISGWQAHDLDGNVDDTIQRLIASARVDAPKLLGTMLADGGPWRGSWRPTVESSRSIATHRDYIDVQVAGDASLLEYWPDQDGANILPLDEQRWIPGLDTFDELDRIDVARYKSELLGKLWRIVPRGPNGELVLRTFVDLTDDELARVASGDLDARALVDANRTLIGPIVDAIGTQTDRFFDTDLPALLVEQATNRRRDIAVRRAVVENLSWPDGWKVPSPVLVEAEALSPLPEYEYAEPSDITVPHRSRLDPASFADVQRIIRVWADSIERHPKAYESLEEDRLSDLLVATLNATLPGASREVYSRGGRSDIFIRADVLSEGRGPAKIFICESKWWSGPRNASKAAGQLFGYLNNDDTAAVLLTFVGLRRPDTAPPAGLAALQARSEYVATHTGEVEGWPIVEFSADGRRVDLCLAFVKVPTS